MTAVLARLRASLALWPSQPASDIPQPAVRAAAHAYDAIESIPARLTRRGFKAERARLRREVQSLFERLHQLEAAHRRTSTIRDAEIRDLTAENRNLKSELNRVRRIADAANLGHVFAVRVPEQRTGARS